MSKLNIPQERTQTIRQAIVESVQVRPYSIAELSKKLSKSEKELVGHLEQLLSAKKIKLIAPSCLKCGYEFEGRKKVAKPGKCPECKGTFIDEPLFEC